MPHLKKDLLYYKAKVVITLYLNHAIPCTITLVTLGFVLSVCFTLAPLEHRVTKLFMTVLALYMFVCCSLSTLVSFFLLIPVSSLSVYAVIIIICKNYHTVVYLKCYRSLCCSYNKVTKATK